MKVWRSMIPRFESSVNSEGIETLLYTLSNLPWFESSVNSEGIETYFSPKNIPSSFESSVNSEGIETLNRCRFSQLCLRAV